MIPAVVIHFTGNLVGGWHGFEGRIEQVVWLWRAKGDHFKAFSRRKELDSAMSWGGWTFFKSIGHRKRLIEKMEG